MTVSSIRKQTQEIKEWLGTGSINIFGRQFSGKDTQASSLAPELGATIIGGGEILRSQVLQPRIQAMVDEGELIPSDDYEQIVLPYLSKKSLRNRSLVLSSLGRTVSEQAAVIRASSNAGHPIKAVPVLQISEQEAFRRLSSTPNRNRAQDNEAAMRVRMDQYLKHTVPVIEAYEQLDLAITIDAMQPEPLVYRSLVGQLHDFAREHSS